MAEVAFRAPHLTDVGHVAARMRAKDQAEIRAAGLTDVERVLRQSVASSTWALACVAGGEAVAIFGVAPPGRPWLLGTDRLTGRLLMRHGPAYIAQMLRDHPRLANFVHAENDLSMTWLRHMGFTLGPAAPYGKHGAMFHRFEMTA